MTNILLVDLNSKNYNGFHINKIHWLTNNDTLLQNAVTNLLQLVPFFPKTCTKTIINYNQFPGHSQCKGLLKTKTIDPNSFPRI